ncbi:coagulation factor VII-like isoform X2 [Cimex lectularius]|uniref:limulus clotting factor C n=1 Tax=Cimex lectularius TaxID=79782 RepID=A0A8I6TJP7_CIMLE|nr:coagulation factor VII-like isoform X2 [Cimex lectularius]
MPRKEQCRWWTVLVIYPLDIFSFWTQWISSENDNSKQTIYCESEESKDEPTTTPEPDIDVASSNNASEHDDVSSESTPVAEGLTSIRLIRPKSRCYTAEVEGACYSGEDCFRKGGQVTTPCLKDGISIVKSHLHCCAFIHTCGDVSSEKVTYFRSPDYPSKSTGSLACDYDLIVQSTTCAIRVDYLKVNLARKLGGVCDIDQLFILNSVDGPTAGQCGPLSGYSTTVAVNPGQSNPVKIALLIQNEGTYHWDIKVTQLACNQVKHFRRPKLCGEVKNEILSGVASSHGLDWYFNDNNVWKKPNIPQHTWWSYPEPIFNTFYYGSTKRYMEQENQGKFAKRRIVSGSDAHVGEFPWVVAIGLDQMFFCGGALITDSLVLTAAHCLMARDTPIGSLVLHLGDLDLTSPNETNHVLRGVSKVMFHSHFHPFLLANDIALLRLDQPVAFTDTIQPVCLPGPRDVFTGQKGTVVGWGVTSFPMGEPSPILQKLDVETMSNFQCSRMIDEPVTLGMICAAPSNLQGTCFGDSGGPLTVLSKSGRYILIGVVSFGVTGCAVMPAFPDLYTRVSEYLKWIDVNAI